MTQLLARNEVAIDTNVFQHLLNPQNNVNSHINRLLEYLIGQRTTLVVDEDDSLPTSTSSSWSGDLENPTT